MMWDANVPIQFWPEAIRTACYLHRRSPTSSLSANRSPYEALYGSVAQVGHLRRFGCQAYKHIPPVQRTRRSSETAQVCAWCWDMYTIWPRSGESGTSIQEETGEQSNAQVWYSKSKKTQMENLRKNWQKELSFQKLQPNWTMKPMKWKKRTWWRWTIHQDCKLVSQKKKKKNTSLCRCHQLVGSDMSCWAELRCY